MPDQLQLTDIVLLGRTFDEYCRMFALNAQTLERDVILDVASGVSSFCAEASRAGARVTASDRVYSFSASEIAAKCALDLEMVMAQLPGIADLYVWDFFPDIAALTRQREHAYTTFVEDFAARGQQRYVPVTYPQTPFADGQFTLALVSHFLFLYEEHLSYDFHRQTLRELLRITSKEIRIFPLINLKGQRSAHLTTLLNDPEFAAYEKTIRRVEYEFMRGGNEMLELRKP